jgi:hypothetical protein
LGLLARLPAAEASVVAMQRFSRLLALLALLGCHATSSTAGPPTSIAPPAVPTPAAFRLGPGSWQMDLPKGAHLRLPSPRGADPAESDLVFTVSRYEEGAGPINLRNARAIILDRPDPPVLFERGPAGNLGYELVVDGPAGPRGERSMDDPDGGGATIVCGFAFAGAAEERRWRGALDACRSLRLAP